MQLRHVSIGAGRAQGSHPDNSDRPQKPVSAKLIINSEAMVPIRKSIQASEGRTIVVMDVQKSPVIFLDLADQSENRCAIVCAPAQNEPSPS